MHNTVFFSSPVTAEQLSNPFWVYACSRYQVPTVQQICLQLQSQHQADINLLLCAGWAAQNGWRLVWPGILNEISRWQGEIIRPLREIRQKLSKSQPAENHFRTKLLALELQAEKTEIARLYVLLLEDSSHKVSSAESGARLACANLLSYLDLLDPPQPATSTTGVGVLAAQLSSLLIGEIAKLKNQ